MSQGTKKFLRKSVGDLHSDKARAVAFYTTIGICILIANILLYKFLYRSPLEHHTTETLLHMLSAQPEKGIMGYSDLSHSDHKPFYYFSAYAIYYLFGLPPITSLITLCLLSFNFFIFSICFTLTKLSFTRIQILFGLVSFFWFFKYISINYLVIEDNIGFYGFLILGTYYFSQVHKSIKDALLAALFLGLSASFHTSQLVNIFTIIPFSLLAYTLGRERLIKRVGFSLMGVALTYYLMTGLYLEGKHYFLSEVLRTIFTLDIDHRNKITLGGSIFSNGTEGLRYFLMGHNDNFFYVLTCWSLFLLSTAILILKTLKSKLYKRKEYLLSLSLLTTSLTLVLFYGPLRIPRWDAFGLHLVFLALISVSLKSDKWNKYLLGLLVALSLVNVGDYFQDKSSSLKLYSRCKNQVYMSYYYNEVDNILKNQHDVYILPWEYLTISNYISTQLSPAVSPERIYYKSPRDEYFQSPSLFDLTPPASDLRRGYDKSIFQDKLRLKEISVSPPMADRKAYFSPFLGISIENCKARTD